MSAHHQVKPTAPHRGFDADKAALHAYFDDLIAEHRADGTSQGSVDGMLGQGPDGAPLLDREHPATRSPTFLIAGQLTTSTDATTVYNLVHHPAGARARPRRGSTRCSGTDG